MKTPVHAPRARFTFHVSVTRRIAYVLHILVFARPVRAFDSLSARRTATGSELFSSLTCLHHYIYIKYLFNGRDDHQLENPGETTVLACEMFSSSFSPSLQKIACLSSLSSIHLHALSMCFVTSLSRQVTHVLFSCFFFFFARSARVFDLFPLHAPHVYQCPLFVHVPPACACTSLGSLRNDDCNGNCSATNEGFDWLNEGK